MDAYSVFAQVYDECMDNVPYETGAARLRELLTAHQINNGLIAELGCGTGNITELLAGYGYDMIGIDNSAEMLEQAMDKKAESGSDILYLQQNMQEFELYGTVRAVVSFCDCVNYITEPSELTEVFRLVNNYLDPKGLFLFDFHTTYYYREILKDSTFAECNDCNAYIWDNYYDEESGLNSYELNLFVQDSDTDSELYRRFREEHIQRGYTLDEIKKMLQSAGLTFLDAYDDYSTSAATEHSERILILAQETGK